MPELPEVETVRRGLAPTLEGQRLLRVHAHRPDLRFPLPANFTNRLVGRRVTSLGRRAKYLIAYLDSGEALIMHLGMSGRFSIVDARGVLAFDDYAYSTEGDPKHNHVEFDVEGGAKVIYNDPRRFGFMDIVAIAELESCKHFKAMGPEPLSNQFSAAGLAAALCARKTPIKSALLDQSTVAGLGNIYVCEALFRAGISPTRPSNAVTPSEIVALSAAIRAVLSEAIDAGGSTLRDFAAADGSLGGFQERFDVYGREGLACPHCAQDKGITTLVQRLVQSGRSSFFCPSCQT
ncbi:bifunctional DNA-formamidopyrimidine glycosylase/DNA-(apurinic or apyrimidinic site) lyase [Candidatus Phycosocius spiralis]|uniref:Formamidopyrimidine-DNA glycosylase n=1 Tax=Candidatus Phycosocius spiralis TaxID=2815099 RepID=A0ABQ4PTI3_9PROT|nr:bifunctional DNA-formamidopyrimidine glycosylase/DNA-(apurinic or apyrimidinic site) lyase [Candidatus Phycosocius spiralis]GIU66295.1 formamidopyrimidine-DNA glycosylase [Candidatus Phycosocius spiralis]